MSKQKSTTKPHLLPHPATPPDRAFTDKLAALEAKTGLDQSQIIHALVMSADAKLVEVCARSVGVIVPQPERWAAVIGEAQETGLQKAA